MVIAEPDLALFADIRREIKLLTGYGLARLGAPRLAAVCDAYGWPHDLPDEGIIERLLALNPERAPM